MPIDRQKLIESVDRRSSLEFLARMVRFKSYSNTTGELELARFMAQAMRELGLEAELQPVEGERCNAIGRWRGTGGGKSLLFNGHMDTNPVSEGWTVDPWGGKIDDD
jgi:acetylornithine deacetylase